MVQTKKRDEEQRMIEEKKMMKEDEKLLEDEVGEKDMENEGRKKEGTLGPQQQQQHRQGGSSLDCVEKMKRRGKGKPENLR